MIGAVTFLQRSTVFLITGMVYLGFGLSGSSLFHILAVQAAVYIAVDMLPVPGAQGITELMYAAVFGGVFGAQYVKASMVLVRGMDFYVPFCVSMLIVLAGHGVSYVRRQRKLCVLFRRDADCFCEGTQIIAVVVEAAGFAGFRDGTALIKQ